jgi:predicted PhzF superfamily epimerase YddE/YHI9
MDVDGAGLQRHRSWRGRAMTLLHVVSVFSNKAGGHGNLLGVFLDGHEIPAGRRQVIAADLGFSETVFVDDPADPALHAGVGEGHADLSD